MRDLKELYEILYKEIKDKDCIFSLCNHMKWVFTNQELYLIGDHFESQRFLHPEFMTDERNWNQTSELFWWTEEEDYNPINRKAFIQKIISTL